MDVAVAARRGGGYYVGINYNPAASGTITYVRQMEITKEHTDEIGNGIHRGTREKLRYENCGRDV